MGAYSGKFGYVALDVQGGVQTASTVQNWNVSLVSNPPFYRASNTRLGTGRVNGINDWTGSFNQYGVWAPLANGGASGRNLFPGDRFVFQGFTNPDPTNPLYNQSGRTYTGSAIVSEVNLRWNWRDNEIPMQTVSFEGDGPLEEAPQPFANPIVGTNPALPDLSIPNPQSVCGLKIAYSIPSLQAPIFVDWFDVASASLTLRTENIPYINSSTVDNFGVCFVRRTPGPLDFDCDILEDNNSMNHETTGVLPVNQPRFTVGDDLILNLYVDPIRFWQLRFVKVSGISDLTVNIETGDIIDQTVNLQMNGFLNISGTPTAGFISDPSAAVVWPNTFAEL